MVPVGFDLGATAAFADRVDRPLRPIPDPLTAEALPNGETRERIESERAAAREALPASGGSQVPLLAAERYATARDHAATAVGTWAGVTVKGDPEAVTATVGTVRRRAYETPDSLSGVAADLIAGAAVYGPVERWYDEPRRRTLVGGDACPAGRANPIRTGEAVGDVERVRSYAEAGRHLRDRDRASLTAQFLPAVTEPDADLASDGRSARRVARAYAAYRWIETVTTAARAVAESAAAAADA